MSGRRRVFASTPFLIVRDVRVSAAFYEKVLGYQEPGFWGEPPSFCMVERGGVVIMLSQVEKDIALRPNNLASREGGAWDAYVWVRDATALHDEFVAKGATIARALCDQEYGCRDFDVLDCNGYRLCFGQNLTTA